MPARIPPQGIRPYPRCPPSPSTGPATLHARGRRPGITAGLRNRFLLDGEETGGRVALVRHLFAPRSLAAPLHRHHPEDGFTYLPSGRVGAVLGDDEVVAGLGDLVVKPRNQVAHVLERR